LPPHPGASVIEYRLSSRRSLPGAPEERWGIGPRGWRAAGVIGGGDRVPRSVVSWRWYPRDQTIEDKYRHIARTSDTPGHGTRHVNRGKPANQHVICPVVEPNVHPKRAPRHSLVPRCPVVSDTARVLGAVPGGPGAGRTVPVMSPMHMMYGTLTFGTLVSPPPPGAGGRGSGLIPIHCSICTDHGGGPVFSSDCPKHVTYMHPCIHV